MTQTVASADWLLNLTSIFRRPSAESDEMMDLSDEEMDCDVALDLLQGLPSNLFQERPKPKLIIENPSQIVELSCRKLKGNTKRNRRPLQQTLLIHRTLNLAKTAKVKSTRPPLRRAASRSPDEGFDGVAKPPKAFCRKPSQNQFPVHQYNPVGDPQLIQPPRAVQAW